MELTSARIAHLTLRIQVQVNDKVNVYDEDFSF